MPTVFSSPKARRASSRPVRISEPTMMKAWSRNEPALLISPFCWLLYVAHCSEVQAMGAMSRVASRLNGGFRSMPAAMAAAVASAVNVAEPPMAAENASSLPGTRRSGS